VARGRNAGRLVVEKRGDVVLQQLPQILDNELRRARVNVFFEPLVDAENVDELVVQSITAETAGILKKYMPRAFGRASLIRRRKSCVKVTLAPYVAKAKKGTPAPAKKAKKKTA